MKRLLPLSLALVLALSACAPTGAEAPGETALPSPSAAPTQAPAPSGPSVYTDWSQLGPHEKPEQPVSKFTRRYEEFTDTLIPADDYGPLIPFPGAIVTRPSEDGWGWMEDYNLYGLMTLEGEVVVDPVFSSAFAPNYWDERSGQSKELNCLVLQKVVKDKNGEPIDVAALCARDGSWCTDFDYSFDWELLMGQSEGNVIPMRRRRDSSRSLFYRDLAFLDVRTGEEVKTVDLGKVLERWPDAAWSLIYNLRYGERYAIFSDDTAHYLFDSETGEVQVLEELLNLLSGELESPYDAPFYEGLCAVKTASGWGYIDGEGHWVTDPIYEEAWPFEDGRALVRDLQAGNKYTYIDHSGRVVYTLPDAATSISYFGELLSYKSVGKQYFLDKDLHTIPLPEDLTNPYKQGDWFYQELPDPSPTVPGGWAFWNYKTGVRWDFPGETLGHQYIFSGNYATFQGRADQRELTLLDLTTGEASVLGRWATAFVEYNKLTGEPYLWLDGMDGAPSELRTLQGDTLYTTDAVRAWAFSLWGDLALYTGGDDATTLTNWKTGELLFSWPLHPMED